MAYNTINNLTNVYNFYMTSYAPKSSTPYDTHKKSELRSVYNSIVKMNKESPLFILDTSKESREFAVGIKENARELRNTIASLGGLDEEEMLNKKVAYSSNTDIATANMWVPGNRMTTFPPMRWKLIISLRLRLISGNSFPPMNLQRSLPTPILSTWGLMI